MILGCLIPFNYELIFEDVQPDAKKVSTSVIPIAMTTEKDEADKLFIILNELGTLYFVFEYL